MNATDSAIGEYQKYMDDRMQERACQMCGRELTTAKSIELGYGPTCYKKMKKRNEKYHKEE